MFQEFIENRLKLGTENWTLSREWMCKHTHFKWKFDLHIYAIQQMAIECEFIDYIRWVYAKLL